METLELKKTNSWNFKSSMYGISSEWLGETISWLKHETVEITQSEWKINWKQQTFKDFWL